MSLLSNLVILLLLFINIILSKIAYATIVQTSSGPVRGEILSTFRRSLKYASFRGIPYAEPPIGNLRFKPPVAKQTWTDIYNATTEGNVCIQYNERIQTTIGSENCLFLSIFTPHTNFKNVENNLKAVMVWIHGGGFSVGSSRTSDYGPDFLLEDDVIVISINYRLGPFGFLNLNHENATGNAGLKDQNLALKWIHKSIKNFGGNPNKITIIGQSAGAVSVDLHILSNMSKGLFNQSISMSGSALCFNYGVHNNEASARQALELGSKLGINATTTNDLLQNLYSISAKDIIIKTHELPLLPFGPVIEKNLMESEAEPFLSECVINKYLNGNYNKNLHMMGFTSNEAKSFFANRLLGWATKALKSLEYAYIPLDIPSFRKFVSSGGSSNISEDFYNELIKTGTELYYITGIDSKQKFLNINNQYPVYYYQFGFETDSNLGFSKNHGHNVPGVGHADDLPYLFYMPSAGLAINQPDIEITINRYVKLMTNFAKYGNPTPNLENDLLNITWPNSGDQGFHLEINRNLSVRLRPISPTVERYQVAGISSSLLLNDCIQNCIKN